MLLLTKEWARIQANFVVDELGSGKKLFSSTVLTEIPPPRCVMKCTKVLPAGGIEIVKTMAHNWNDTQAKQLMAEVISSGLEYDGIVNQESALGIISAIEEAGIPYPAASRHQKKLHGFARLPTSIKMRKFYHLSLLKIHRE